MNMEWWDLTSIRDSIVPTTGNLKCRMLSTKCQRNVKLSSCHPSTKLLKSRWFITESNYEIDDKY